MKVIFLDVDGVLTSEDYLNGVEFDLSEEKIKLLKKIVEQTNAKIVLSSSWKNKTRNFPVLENLLNKNDLEIYDTTPEIKRIRRINHKYMDLPIVNIDSKRGEEINKWVLDHNPESFVILDDNLHNFDKFDLDKHLVQTNYYDGGLKEEHVEKALEILNNKKKKLR